MSGENSRSGQGRALLLCLALLLFAWHRRLPQRQMEDKIRRVQSPMMATSHRSPH